MSIAGLGSSTQLAQLRQAQQAAFKAADADGDGQLSLSEFQSVGQNLPGAERDGRPHLRGAGGPGGQFGGETLSALLSTQSADDLSQSILSAGDGDGDGLLSSSEIASALAANAPDDVKGQGLEGKMAEDIVSALDTDGDGSLSSSEISTAISNAAQHESQAQAADAPRGGGHAHGAGRKAFDSLDTNKDGVVSAEELAAAGTTATARADQTSAASDLIKAADQDGDGALSGREFGALLRQGREANTDSSSAVASLIGGSSAAADLMQKLLAQLDTALTSSSSSNASSSQASGGVSVTA